MGTRPHLAAGPHGPLQPCSSQAGLIAVTCRNPAILQITTVKSDPLSSGFFWVTLSGAQRLLLTMLGRPYGVLEIGLWSAKCNACTLLLMQPCFIIFHKIHNLNMKKYNEIQILAVGSVLASLKHSGHDSRGIQQSFKITEWQWSKG